MKKSKYLYKNCPYEDYGFSSCRVCPNFKKCSKRKGEQIKRNEKNELKEIVLKIEIVLVCVLVMSMIIGCFTGFSSYAEESSGKEKNYVAEPAEGVGRMPSNENKEIRDEIATVITPVITVSAAAIENKPEFFEGIKIVELKDANEFGPCNDWIYNISEQDMLYIAKVVWAEARGECLEGQVAVAAVILNRYYSGKSEFNTSSIYKVVTQSGAFASIKGVENEDLEKYPDCMRAVRLACRGWDPTRETFETGALYFYNPEGVSGYQARIREGIVVHTIGDHNFHIDFNWDAVNR